MLMNKNLQDPENHKLSIQVSLDGFSFCIKTISDSRLVDSERFHFEHIHSPEQALVKIKEVFSTLPQLNNTFQEVVVVYDNELFTIVPEYLFDQNNLADYLKFNTKILKTDFTVYDELEALKLINVYIPFSNINNFFFDHFGTFTFYHSQTVFLKSVLSDTNASENVKEVFVHVSKTSIALIARKNDQLLLNNRFNYENAADCVYYILYCYEQLQLDPEINPIILKGSITENDEVYKLIYDYIRHVGIEQTAIESNLLKNTYLQYL
ncbi:DUF3822 family protein [Leeuwenhoekiella nanhaiensis]|uniref:DUF3822 domain-containing protein n=1 Tax=Leeuwenhoekiella nanhaiensis TaxID=1655491 RepID=A0A2G1VUB9_9FLAO|nr:DUF3822 family protein [Leeuwenhoekiella nanhaiensis]PHQ30377.1 hypothetical protein CJ305_05290 [Leeuwenhoekiella nanhaiensis]